MTKKIIKAENKKNGLDINKITKSIIENEEAISKIADGITDLIDGKPSKKKKNKSNSMSKVIDLAGTILKK